MMYINNVISFRGGGEMGMGIDGNWLKNSYNLCYDENEHNKRVCRPIISKYSKFQLNLVWYQKYLFSIFSDFDRKNDAQIAHLFLNYWSNNRHGHRWGCPPPS